MAKKGASGDASDWDRRMPSQADIDFAKYKASPAAKVARDKQNQQDAAVITKKNAAREELRKSILEGNFEMQPLSTGLNIEIRKRKK